jgi:tRNA threonylcarbamoyladenosine biosynthesis protein TsaE
VVLNRELELSTTGATDTRRLAATVARALRVGDVVSLTGELGAGKTCFVQGAATALGVTERVTSPTFLLRRDYQGRVPIVHLDVYRLDTLQEASELGLDEATTSVTFIEWGDAMQPLLPADHLEIAFSAPEPDLDMGEGEGERQRAGGRGAAGPDETRRIVLRPRGADWKRRIVSLAVDCAPWRSDGGPPQLDMLEL